MVSHEIIASLSIFNLFKLNGLWPYYQKHVNYISLNRTTLQSLALQIFEAFVQISLIENLSLNQTLLTFVLYVKANLDDSMDSGNFFMIGYMRGSFNSKVFYYSYTWARSLCEGGTSFCTGTYICKTLLVLTCFFDWLYSTHCLSSFSYLSTAFDSISSNIDEVLLINPSAKTGLPILVELIDLVNSLIIFL